MPAIPQPRGGCVQRVITPNIFPQYIFFKDFFIIFLDRHLRTDDILHFNPSNRLSSISRFRCVVGEKLSEPILELSKIPTKKVSTIFRV